jgi:hypothetical protein
MLDGSSCLPKLYFPLASSECVPQPEVFVAGKGAITVIIHVYKTPEDLKGKRGKSNGGEAEHRKGEVDGVSI